MPAANTALQGRYRIVRQLGRGGMGTVYEALDLRLSRTVAIKQTTVKSEKLHQAFDHEAKLLANLRHPSLPKILDHFSEDDEQYLVMEYVPGDDLGQLLEKRGYPFSSRRVLSWTLNLLDALIFLHGHHPPIIHRDIKPSNLKLSDDDGIILLDFGLAKGSAGKMTHGPATSVFGYTQSYSSLEQIQGERTSQQSDLYSLGATVYHLLTGTMPVDALKRITESLYGHDDPLKPIQGYNPTVSSGFARAVMRAMSLKPGDRPSSAVEMKAELLGLTQNETAHYEPEPTIIAEPPRYDPQPSIPELSIQTRSKANILAWAFVIIGVMAIMFLGGAIFQVYRNTNNNEQQETTSSNAQAKDPAIVTEPQLVIAKPTPVITPTPAQLYNESNSNSEVVFTPSPTPQLSPIPISSQSPTAQNGTLDESITDEKAQETSNMNQIYAPNDVEVKARILSRPEPQYTEEARKNHVSGTVIIRAVFSSNGEVTNIRAIDDLPDGLTERAMAMARMIKFSPAMKDGHPVSQYIQIEYNFVPNW